MFARKVLPGWLLLVLLQAGIALVLFHDFIFGDKYFAFRDIGSDTIGQFVPTLMHLARPASWTSTWSFGIGLGAVNPLTPAPFTLLGIAGGAEQVLDLRIWVYLAKIACGGLAFYAFVATLGARARLLLALAYSFCGYVMTDGQWDPFSNEFVAYAVILWALAHHLRMRDRWAVPLALAYAIYSGAFFVSICIFLGYAAVAAAIASDKPLATLAYWLRRVLPQCVLGVLLAAPVVIPLAFQLLDNPRVTGAQAGFAARLAELFTLNDGHTLLIELAGLYHKNILGVGNQHLGWMNYLESPGYYVGLLALLLIPQAWRGTRADRRILAAAALALAVFALFPAVRYLAYGFGLDYFRINNLWISILLLVLFARALDVVAAQGVHRWTLGATAAALALGLILLARGLPLAISLAHVLAILVLLVSAVIFCLALARPGHWNRLARCALAFVAIEAVLLNYPGVHAQRQVQSTRTSNYADGTAQALEFLQARDPGFYRVEKDYDSISYNDALAQGYKGVKSYWIQSRSVVDFYIGLGLLPRHSPIKNFTNWLPPFGERFVLDSLVAVKYMIARKTLEWPGFEKIGEVGALGVYENRLALPLGVVYTQRLQPGRLAALPPHMRDIALLNAVTIEDAGGSALPEWNPDELARERADWLDRHYLGPARMLQQRALAIESFADDQIVGRVATAAPGVLVVSIPYARGWTLAVDGQPQPLVKANLGFIGAALAPGEHRVELRYAQPGLIPGVLIAALALVASLLLWRRTRGA